MEEKPLTAKERKEAQRKEYLFQNLPFANLCVSLRLDLHITK
jgi:hypothetical protein